MINYLKIIEFHFGNMPRLSKRYLREFVLLFLLNLIIQIIAGIVLYIYYTWNIEIFNYIEYIDINNELLTRYLYSNTASALLLVIYLLIKNNLIKLNDLLLINDINVVLVSFFIINTVILHILLISLYFNNFYCFNLIVFLILVCFSLSIWLNIIPNILKSYCLLMYYLLFLYTLGNLINYLDFYLIVIKQEFFIWMNSNFPGNNGNFNSGGLNNGNFNNGNWNNGNNNNWYYGGYNNGGWNGGNWDSGGWNNVNLNNYIKPNEEQNDPSYIPPETQENKEQLKNWMLQRLSDHRLSKANSIPYDTRLDKKFNSADHEYICDQIIKYSEKNPHLKLHPHITGLYGSRKYHGKVTVKFLEEFSRTDP